MTKVKICGITNLADALAACEAGADALGFNFAIEARPKGRYIDPEDAQRIIDQLPPWVYTVAVCVNEPQERVAEFLAFCDWVQLHGEETPEFCEPFADRTIKAFRARPGFEPGWMLEYSTSLYLLDAYVPNMHGGTGKMCDLDLAKEAIAMGRPLILAGGLTPENVAGVIREVQPYAVDVAGGVESGPGAKDHRRMKDFVRNAKNSLFLPG